MNKKPNKWLAVVLSVISPPVGMLYVARLGWAAIYFFAGTMVAFLGFVYARQMLFGAVALALGFKVICAVHAYRMAGQYPAEAARPHYSRWYGLLAAYAALFVTVFAFRAFLYEPFRMPSGSMHPSIEVGSHFVVQKWGYGHYGSYDMLPFQRPISAGMRRGELYVFVTPEDPSVQFVKRLIGLPGDRIVYRNKQLSINGRPVEQRRVGNDPGDRPGEGGSASLSRFEETLDGTTYSIVLHEGIAMNVPPDVSFPQKEKCVYEANAVSCEVPPGHYYFMGDNRDNSRDSRYWGFVPASDIVGRVIAVYN